MSWMITGLELRRANRYRVAARVTFWWPNAKGTSWAGSGITRDVSACGLMVMTSDCPPVGAPIQLTVSLPRQHRRRRGLELRGEGAVVRIEYGEAVGSENWSIGFAASVQLYSEMPSVSKQICGDSSQL
jgi:hypothetical protein